MAGMLPGVESARRRRLRGSGGWSDSPSAFGSARIHLNLTPPSLLQRGRSMLDQSDEDHNLGGPAREAKERLDGRLRGHFSKKQQLTRGKDEERLGIGLKKKRFGWGRIMWKSWEWDEEECAICLEGFKCDKVTHLPCAHRFHSHCLFPWLETNTLCPCCRATVPSFL